MKMLIATIVPKWSPDVRYVCITELSSSSVPVHFQMVTLKQEMNMSKA